MKKLMIGVFALTAMAATSCRKSYTCECKPVNGSAGITRDLPKQSLSDARSECDRGDVQGITECEIKL
ncbi:hypothetical protein [Rurimicrobium arvi]|uniref:Lipoprotein n=1 Tax=Rurimicrobium arvi TaxID=2049916 RepID=A0ABP8MSA5_9BACT